jgi:methionyl-tRNA formyltransferase
MKLAIFTTNTPHHLYFVRELQKAYPINLIINETEEVKAKFETGHPFEKERDEYERKFWFNNHLPSFEDFAPTLHVPNINDLEVERKLLELQPDTIVVFGTRRIKPHIINTCPEGMINLHGGDPESYRGLDSHMWAIYHMEFHELITTIHRVNPILDDGDYLFKLPVNLEPNMPITHLRKSNTETCLNLTLMALEAYKRFGKFLSMKQKTKGKYYSFMPSELKSICIPIFEQYTSNL